MLPISPGKKQRIKGKIKDDFLLQHTALALKAGQIWLSSAIINRMISGIAVSTTPFLTPYIIWRHFARNKVLKKPERSNKKWE